MTLGQRIRLLRKDKKLNQGELGKLAGLSLPYISDVERDKVNPSVEVISGIANAFDMSLSDFFVGVGGKQAEGQGIPESFVDFVIDTDFRDEITSDWKNCLLSIHLRGKRPPKKKDWISIYLLLKRILT